MEQIQFAADAPNVAQAVADAASGFITCPWQISVRLYKISLAEMTYWLPKFSICWSKMLSRTRSSIRDSSMPSGECWNLLI